LILTELLVSVGCAFASFLSAVAVGWSAYFRSSIFGKVVNPAVAIRQERQERAKGEQNQKNVQYIQPVQACRSYHIVS
jgi:hypothetical protein